MGAAERESIKKERRIKETATIINFKMTLTAPKNENQQMNSKKRVRFQNYVNIRMIPCVKDPAVKQQLYYSELDMAMMRVEAERAKLLQLRKQRVLSILSERESNKKSSHAPKLKRKSTSSSSKTTKSKEMAMRKKLQLSGCKINLPKNK